MSDVTTELPGRMAPKAGGRGNVDMLVDGRWQHVGTVDTLTYPTGDDGNPDMSFPIRFYLSDDERLQRYRAEVAYVRELVRRELAL